MSIHGVLLDLDGTLVRTGSAIVEAGRSAMQAAWPGLEPSVYQDAATRYLHDGGGFFPRYASGELSYEQMRSRRFARVAQELGLAATPQNSDRHRTVFLRRFAALYRLPGRLFEDTLPLLERLAHADLPVGVLTNSSRELTEAKLDGVGLTGRLDLVMTRDTLGFGKPDARVFHEACARLGTAAQHTTYIGDELDTDAVGARDAGLQGVWLCRDGAAGPVDGVRVISTLDEVCPTGCAP